MTMQFMNYFLKGACWVLISFSAHATAVVDVSYKTPETRLERALKAVDASFKALNEHIVSPTEHTLNLPNALSSSIPGSEHQKMIAQLNTSLETMAPTWRNSSQEEKLTSGIKALTYVPDRGTFSREYAQEDLHLILSEIPTKDLSQCTFSDLSGVGTTLINPLLICSIALPNNLSEWPEGALSSCKYLERISSYGPVGTASLTLTKEHNLGPLHRLESFEIPATVRVLGDAGCGTSDDYRIIPVNVKSLTFPTTITSIGKYIAYKCTHLTTVILANRTALTTIGPYAFYHCSSLTSIDVSGCTNLTTIGNYAFADCSNLILFDASGTQLTSIGLYAFADTKLACAILPTTFTSSESIGFLAFPSTFKSLIWKGSSAPSIDVFDSMAFDGDSYSTAVTNGLKVTTVS